MGRLVDAILGLSGPAAYGLVGLLAFGEAAAFVGLVLPGEVAVLLGGVVASRGQASLPVMLAVAAVAAIAGDSVGYEIGRRYGPRILAWPPFQRRFSAQVAKASAYLEERGGRAVFLGRWTSLLRALVPGLAGMARMPYGRFLAFNVVGGAAWASTFVLAGYVAGASWRRVEQVAGRASLLLLALIVLAVVVRWVTRRLVARAELVGAWLQRVHRSAAVEAVTRRVDRQLTWVRRASAPAVARGVGWSVGLVVAGAAAWLVGVAVQDLLAREELFLLDQPIATWVADHTTAPVVTVARTIVTAVAPPVGVGVVLGLAVVAIRWSTRAHGMRLIASAVATGGLATGLQAVLPASVAGTRFPALSVAWLTAALVSVLPAATAARGLAFAIRVAGAGTFLLVAIAAAELVAGDAAASGVVGGLGLGLLVAVVTELVATFPLDDSPKP